MSVVQRGQVSLYDQTYPILGPVQRIPVTPFPGKITIGDYTRDDEQVASSWVQTSWSGGYGIETGTYPRDQDRFWYSTLDTRWTRTLALPPKVTSTSLSATFSNHSGSILYGSTPVFYIGAKLFTLNNSGVVTLVKTYGSDILDLAVNQDLLWVAGGASFDVESWDGTTFTSHTGHAANFLAPVGGWLYLMDSTGAVEYYNPGDNTWNAAGALYLPPTTVYQLLSFQNASGDFTLYVTTGDGLYVYDQSTTRFFKTQISWTRGLPVGRACVWRGELYIPVGSSIFRWNVQTLAPVGMDADQGLPIELPDRVVALYPSPGYLVAILSGRTFLSAYGAGDTIQDTNTIMTGSRLGNRPVFGIAARGGTVAGVDQNLIRGTLIMTSSGGGWSAVASSPLDSTAPIGVLSYGSKFHALWYQTGTLFSTDLPATLYNPLLPAIVETEAEGTLISPWFDASWAEIDKTALRLKLRARTASADLPIVAYYQVDDDISWTLLGSATSVGETTFSFAEAADSGVFRRIRIKLTLRRLAGETTASPILTSWSLSFLRRPDIRYGYQFTVDLTQPYGLSSPTQMREALLTAMGTKAVGNFSFAEDDETKQVVISRIQLIHDGGYEGQEGSQGAVIRAAVGLMEV